MSLEKQIVVDLKNKINVFITGKSGSGKTFLTRKVLELLKEEEMVFAIGGSTGISARNLHDSAKTINSLLGLGIIGSIEEYRIKKRKLDANMADLIPRLDVLIIEEISMIGAPFFDVIVFHLKRYGFKGSILAVGDFKQLSPVINAEDFDPDYYLAFQSENWLFKSYVLDTVKRNSNDRFVKWSNYIRDCDRDALLNDREFEEFITNSAAKEASGDYVKLYSTNREADEENLLQFSKIDNGTVHNYNSRFTLTDQAIFAKNFKFLKEDDFLKNIRPLKHTQLAVGARVMFCVNHPDSIYVNGDIGTVINFIYSSENLETLPVVKIDSNGEEIVARRHLFQFEELIKGEYEVIATISQVPLKLAYALTVHKSQGLSLEKLFIDCKNFFTPRHLYVSWTRSSNSEHFVIRNFDSSVLEQEQSITDLINWFYEEMLPFQNDLIDRQLISDN